ncbi:MAG: YraN family protein [Chloroflexi bacterium RBG_13_68_17]|jgi:putative endonuclease|nr:MAG: YraN family protein [Chloroflexi bacterium RBG_13_68_17]
MSTRMQTGAWGESIALHHLEAQGMHLRRRNWRSAEGEIDLILEEEGCLVFVEVKTRVGHAFGSPEEAITSSKKDRLERVALAYLQAEALEDSDWRVDVVAVELTASGRIRRLDHYRDALDGNPWLRWR